MKKSVSLGVSSSANNPFIDMKEHAKQINSPTLRVELSISTNRRGLLNSFLDRSHLFEDFGLPLHAQLVQIRMTPDEMKLLFEYPNPNAPKPLLMMPPATFHKVMSKASKPKNTERKFDL